MSEQNNLTLLTDLHQPTMAQSYFAERRLAEGTFSVFVRSYPPNRGYFVCAGLEDVLSFLENFAFDASAIEYLAAQNLFSKEFLRYLSELRFTGEVWAIPEGRIVFKEEPLLELSAPIIEAQIVETFINNQLHVQTMIATKAARCLQASGGRPLVDFALRRTHATHAGMKVARVSYLVGFAGTSNVMAGKTYGIPIVGTMAHSFVSSFAHEIDAFRAYVRSFPQNAILLIDTYDTLQGARNAVQVAKEMAPRGQTLIGVRIDSGDLADLARKVRKIFDDANLPNVKIFGSGGLDEYDLAELAEANAPFDSYGVGTRMGTSADAPWMDMAYKLVEYDRAPVLKLSTGKASSPGRKQVFRTRDGSGNFVQDTIGLRDEQSAGENLLRQAMQNGRRTAPRPDLNESRKMFSEDFAALPERFKSLRNPPQYPVETSQQLLDLRERTMTKYAVH